MIRLLALLPVVVFLSAGERLSFAVANLPADVGSLHSIAADRDPGATIHIDATGGA